MIDERRAEVLQAVVRNYIETSQPVSSTSVMRTSTIDASAATIRSEMVALERDGYLMQPHTSAGRIPTDSGYRFFVDHLNEPDGLSAAQQHDVQAFFAHASGELESLLHRTGKLLSDLTGSASVVVAPAHGKTYSVASLQVVRLGERHGVIVVVGMDGTVVKVPVTLEFDEDIDQLARISGDMTRMYYGESLDSERDVRASKAQDQASVDRCVLALRAMLQQPSEDHIFVGGTSRLAGAFEAVETLHSVLTTLEQQFVIVSLVRDLLDRGLNVSIGAELEVQPLATCSLVVAPTVVDGMAAGSVAILGPTRMNYGQALAAVTVVSQQLAEHLRNEP